MSKKILKLLGIIACTYIVGSLLLNIGFKDPIFKREYIVYNNSLGILNMTTSSKNQIFDEGAIPSGGSGRLLFNDTENSNNKKEDFLLKKGTEIVLDSKKVNFRLLGDKTPAIVASGVVITGQGGIIDDSNIFFPFYFSQSIYRFIYKIEIF